MRLIQLTKGYFAQVDDEDFEALNKFEWRLSNPNRSMYAVRDDYSKIKRGGNGKTKIVLMHREIMGDIGGQIIDHIDGNGLNCQKSNLRIANRSQNGANRKSSKSSTSKYLGVSLCKDSRKWRAQITYNKKTISLGRFIMEIDAAKKYNEAAIMYHGEFANINKF